MSQSNKDDELADLIRSERARGKPRGAPFDRKAMEEHQEIRRQHLAALSNCTSESELRELLIGYYGLKAEDPRFQLAIDSWKEIRRKSEKDKSARRHHRKP